ncbi:MAG: hypothetical protein ABI910_14470 [Gemmatimonadota bacterium]
MDTLAGFDFIALDYDNDGKPSSNALDELTHHIGRAGTTDVILMAHGFRNDEGEARSLYEHFLQNFRAHVARPELSAQLSARTFAVGGIFWPSKRFSEGPSEDDGNVQGVGHGNSDDIAATRAELERLRDEYARPDQRDTVEQALALLGSLEDEATQDTFVALLLSLVDDPEPDPTEGLSEVKAQTGSELFEKLGTPIILPVERSDGEGSVMSVGGGRSSGGDGQALSIGSFFKSVAGKAGQVLNMTTWYLMKNRSGSVGANGVAPAVRALKAAHPAVRVHLVGHSLGGRCMAACAKALSANPRVQADSLSLLEAAFSHYGLSPNNGKGNRGFFRDVIERQVVMGPFISTYSFQDTVVGIAYSVSSRLAGDNTKAVGDKNDQYGGIGRNGTQRTAESTDQPMRQVGDRYAFPVDVVNNIDGSGGAITNHGDVTNERVTYAVACSVAQT